MNIQFGKRGINWTDATWNPITGCLHGCPYCYARGFARRYGWSFEPTFHPDRLDEPLGRRKPLKIFVGSNADVFGSWVPREWIESILDITIKAPRHIFQFLTKNPVRLAEFDWPTNCWVGGTIDTRARLQPTLDALSKTRATVRFVSFEPLNDDMGCPDLTMLQWLIVGAQTGPDAHQPEQKAVANLLAAASGAGVPVLMKDNLIWSPRREEFPNITIQPALF